MTERLSSPEQPAHTPRDQVLHEMAVQGWGTGSPEPYDGGRVYLVEIDRFELAECVSAFEEEIATAGLANPLELIGQWAVDVADHNGYQVMQVGMFGDDNCSLCGAHISDPHDPSCPNGGDGESDDSAAWKAGDV